MRTSVLNIAKVLIAYFEQYADLLDEDAKRRLHTNPLRILDTKKSTHASHVRSGAKINRFFRQ